MLGKMTSVTVAGAFMVALFGGGAWYVFQNRDANPAAEFVARINQGDAASLKRLFNVPLGEYTDPAVLQLWVNAVQEAAGTLTIEDPKSVIVTDTVVDGEARQVVSAPLKGAKQDATLELEIAGGGINRFEVLCDAIDPLWYQKLDKTAPYQKEAVAFLQAFLADKPDEAYALLHADAQDKLPENVMREWTAALHTQAGNLKGQPTYVREDFSRDLEERRLRLVYDIESELGAKTRAAIDFKLEGFRFFLIAFDLTGQAL
jgi:hypothetical protein